MASTETHDMHSVESILKISHFVFDEIYFQRKGFLKPKANTEIPIEISSSVNQIDDNHYNVTLRVKVEQEEEYTAYVAITGYCELDATTSETDRMIILRENVPAILFPYARAELTLITAQPETTPLVLPVVNMQALAQNGVATPAQEIRK